jgi:blocked early in transport 1
MGSLYPRFGPSSLHQRDPRSALFEGYDSGAGDRTRNASSSPSRLGYGGHYGYAGAGNGSVGLVLGSEKPAYRPATPNSRYVGIVAKDLAFWHRT